MSKGHYGAGKRQREQDRARKKRDKAERRMRKREEGPGEVPIASGIEFGSQSIEDIMRNMQPGGVGGASSAPPCRLFLGGLSYDTSAGRLREVLGEFGEIEDAVVVKDRTTQQSRGFGFVTMKSRKDAAKAITALDGSELDGRNIIVKVATERDR